MSASCAAAQDSLVQLASIPISDSSLPDAPSPQHTPSASPTEEADDSWLLDRQIHSGKPLTLNDKFIRYLHYSFGPPEVVFPAVGAAIRYAVPPSGYPPEWTNGIGAYGRLYGSNLATQTSKRTATFIVNVVLRDDPRYFPSASKHVPVRIEHALAFILFQKTDKGKTTFALSHFAGAAAGGFVGMAYLPEGYNDPTHAIQRSIREFGFTGVSNLLQEFGPELYPLVEALHFPRLFPVWWTQDHKYRSEYPH